MIPPELKLKIRLLFFADHWKIGTIASQLKIHPDTVRAAIGTDMFNNRGGSRDRTTLTAAYVPFLTETLEQYPTLTSSRLFEMIRVRGYQGSVSQLRRVVSTIRPTKPKEAFLRLNTMPGEQAQADWASFGSLRVGRANRKLSCFVITLSYSRALYLEFFFDQRLENLAAGLVHAFEDWQGSPRTILFDNLRSVVLERRNDLVRFHPHILEVAGHYHFAPLPCNPARGNEKGRVERSIRYIRESFFAARSFGSLSDLNQQAMRWRDEIAHVRRHPEQKEHTVLEVFKQEQPRLIRTPEHPFQTDLIQPVRSGKTIYIRFDLNDYSIPPEAVGKSLLLVASPTHVRILDGNVEVARHVRSFDGHQRISNPAHIEALLTQKKKALSATAHGRLAALVPDSEKFLDEAFRRGESPGRLANQLVALIDVFGATEVSAAVNEAVQKGSPRLNSVIFILNRSRRNNRRQLPSVDLSRYPEFNDLAVSTHNLEEYDDLANDDSDE